MRYCTSCGARNQAAQAFCTQCGALLDETANKATTVSSPPTPVVPGRSSRRSTLTAVLVAFAVGLVAVIGVGFALGRGGDEPEITAATASPTGDTPGTSSAISTPEAASPSFPSSTVSAPQTTEASAAIPQDATQAAAPGGPSAIAPDTIRVSTLTDCPNDLLALTGGTGAAALLDGDLATGWRCDNRKDFREGNINTVPTMGQVLQFEFDQDYELSALGVIEGAAKDSFRWCENGRLQRVQWDFNDGSAPVIMEFPDRVDYPAEGSLLLNFPLKPSRTTSTVTMTVLSIFPAGQDCRLGLDRARPWEYGDTARPSEVKFIGRAGS